MIDSSADGVEFQVPFTSEELERLRRLVECPSRELERAGREDKAKFVEDLGTRLFEAVFSGSVREAWREELRGASAQGRRLVLRLHLAAPEADRWPWEYLRDPRSGFFLGLTPDISIVRLPGETVSIRPLGVAPPFRILGVISTPVDCQPLSGEQEWKKLETSLSSLVTEGRVALELLGSATFEALNCRLRQTERPCHALHFIGHGGFDRERRGGALYFEDSARRAHLVRADELGTILYSRKLRLAVLNACYGALGDPADPYSSVAQSLIRRKVAAVVAMQYAVSDSFALAFSSELYSRLVAGDPIDAAMAEARLALFSKDFKLEWGNPVLYLRSSEERIFDVRRSRQTTARPPKLGPRPEEERPLGLIGQEAVESSRVEKTVRALVVPVIVAVLLAVTLPVVWKAADPGTVPDVQDSPAESQEPSSPPPVIAPSLECPSLPDLNMNLALIPKGELTVGSRKTRTLKVPEPYCIGRLEVTNAQWAQVMGGDPGNQGDLPASGKSWRDAQDFVRALESKYPGRGFRLPTKVEWEFAHRAGRRDEFSFGDDLNLLRDYGNCRGDDKYNGLAPGGRFKPNGSGLYDMHGNVWEWTSDEDPKKKGYWIRMGGDWDIEAKYCTVDRDESSQPDSDDAGFGLRIVSKPVASTQNP